MMCNNVNGGGFHTECAKPLKILIEMRKNIEMSLKATAFEKCGIFVARPEC